MKKWEQIMNERGTKESEVSILYYSLLGHMHAERTYDKSVGRGFSEDALEHWDRHDTTIIRNYAKNGAKMLFIPADDDFEGNERFPYYAASDAVFREVENRVVIATGSTFGIAQIVTPLGIEKEPS